MYNSGMRNISAGAVIAITYFPAPVAIPVIVGMLFQQVLASLVGSVLDKRKLPLNTDRIVSR
jgi:bile acid:Na+ symporter, BASS family